jgi:B-block binding subunit of TFIIIC
LRTPDLRLFVSEDRTWKALTGHEKDDSKVPATEFALLSIIASCRSQGILQTELVRRSGQDARSVPKRTDALNSKGYIEKRQVQAKSAKTSMCVFSRFAHVAAVDAEVPDTKPVQPRDVIDIDAFCQSIFDVLKQHQIISRNDLKDELDFNDIWRRRILSRTIRKFEAIGCVQRVKARSQFHDTMRTLHPCVLLVREPTEGDMKMFKSDYKTLFSTVDQENEDAEEQADMQPSDHSPIRWTPDVNLPNMIASLIKDSGTNGRTNAQVIKEGFGRVFRRPSEHTLNRMTEGWQLSQPLHLKHRAIVRDIGIHGTITHYVHYSYAHFKELVDTARADWAAVTFRPRDAKSSKLTVPPADVPSITDEDGLAPLQPPRKGVTERDYYCIISSKGLGNYATTKSDPVPVVDEQGHVGKLYQMWKF